MGKKRRRKKKSWISLIILLALVVWFARQRSTDSERKVPPPSKTEEKISREPDQQMNVNPSLTDDRSPQAPDDFDQAKKQLRKLFARGRDFYCGCSYDLDRRPQVDPNSCGLRSRSDRAKRIEWEHVVPASIFGQRFAEWKKGHTSCRGRNAKGRNCARQTNPTFRLMEADMYNLEAAVGELNRVRGNYAYGEIPGEPREFGACDFESFAEKIEPRSEIRGDIARIYFYMDARYPGFSIVSASNRSLLEDWDRADPMDNAERERIQKIQDVQGNNFYIYESRLSSREKAGSSISK